jgi:hypothetical protein
MAEWLTVEVLDGGEPASTWRRAFEDGLVGAAITQGARYREWHDTRWESCWRSSSTTTTGSSGSARCPPSARRSTRCPTRSPACSSTADGAAAPVPASRAGPARDEDPDGAEPVHG